MERESNAMPQCRSGCGFYGNPAQDGLCSVCYKDFLRKKQQPPVSSTPSSNNGPQQPAPGQSVTASAVSLRSVGVTQQSFASSIGSSSSTTTTSASSASATSSSPSPSTCAAAANNPAVDITNTAQPTVHSGLFCSDKDVKNGRKNARESAQRPTLSICYEDGEEEEEACGEEEEIMGYELNLVEDSDDDDAVDVHGTGLLALMVGGGKVDEDHHPLEFVIDAEYDLNSSDPESDTDGAFADVDDDDDDLGEVKMSRRVESVAASSHDCPSEHTTSLGVVNEMATSVVDHQVIDANGSEKAKKRKLNTDDSGSLGGHSNNSSIADNDDKDGDKDDGKKKKNRCATCRKKVGLTGFECRCGGLFCAIHRYSDKHECSFDYRELGAAEIRRNNPVVVGEKIQKI